MKAFITGGTGFVGTYLTGRLIELGWEVSLTGTSGKSVYANDNRVTIIACDTKIPGKWQDQVADADIIINLAGKNIFTVWTQQNREEIEQSRILTTRNLVEAIPENGKTVLFSTSAAGYYGDQGDLPIKEDGEPGTGFLADVCRNWEAEANKAKQKIDRTIIMRLGMVLGQGGGALKMMMPSFRFFAGGKLGKGDNWMPWIHIEDLVMAILFIFENKEMDSVVNFCSPVSVQHKTFIKALGKALGKPSFFSIPSFVVKTIMGDLGKELMKSQQMVPEKLVESGYTFKYNDIGSALTALVD